MPDLPILHAPRAVLIVASTAFFFLALGYLPIADTLAIYFVQPLIVTLLAPLLLKEHVGLRRWIAVFIGFIGTLIIIRPGFQTINPGIFLALLAGATSAALYDPHAQDLAKCRSDRHDVPHQCHGCDHDLGGRCFVWVMPTLEQWGLLLTIAVVALVGHYLIIAAYRFGEASLLAPLGYAEMIMAWSAAGGSSAIFPTAGPSSASAF